MSAPPGDGDDALLAGNEGLKARVRRYEAQLIAAALRKTQDNQTEAAHLLQIGMRPLLEKIQRLGIAVPRAPADKR